MTGVCARKQTSTSSAFQMSVTESVMREFGTTYADATLPNMSDAQWQVAASKRRLTWKSPHRLSLSDAVKCYGQIAVNYNEFHAGLIRAFHCAFRDDGIQVTPAREMSVAIYLHVPNAGDLRSRVESFCRERFNADDVDWTEDGTLRCWWD